ncbi:hypothetical protein AX17_000059 [Amanita inopinata Kibby_2008]|nr:hypothetical protein AX17_000059 [Amanita inopinata Kibby_2008]
MDAPAIHRQLKIKVGAVKRLSKEHNLYKKETLEQKNKLDRLVKDGAEGWDVKNATRMLEESNKMIVDTGMRLGKTTEELQDLIESAKQNPGLSGSEELLNAEQILREIKL